MDNSLIEKSLPSVLGSGESGNPFLKLLLSFMRKEIEKDEFYMALYTEAVKEAELYRFRKMPMKPTELKSAEAAFKEKFKEYPKSKLAEENKIFYEWAYERFKSFFDSRAVIEKMNESNRKFLEEMYEFFKTSGNGSMAERVMGVLLTHYEGEGD